jgi:D-alanyl-D-alanine carboxypeptidase
MTAHLIRHARSFISPMRLAVAILVGLAAVSLSLTSGARPALADQRVMAECGAGYTPGSVAATIPSREATAAPPAIAAASAVVIDGDTGRVLYEKDAHARRRPASTTKIMTAIVALESVSEDTWTVSDIDARDMVGSSVMGLRPGMYLTMRELLYGLMLPSGNDAAVAIARNVGGTEERFVELMNAKAEALGLHDTHFVNPHGLDRRQHYSSAYDLALMARYGMNNEEFRHIVGTPDYVLASPNDYELHNGNSLLAKYPGADGVKIGWTERAGWTFVASAVRDGHRLFVALMDTPDRDAEAAALLDYGFGSYTWQPVPPSVHALAALAARFGLPDVFTRDYADCA